MFLRILITISLCFVSCLAVNGQERLIGKGANHEGVVVEYYLQPLSVTSNGALKEAIVKKVFTNDSSSIIMSISVDCIKHKYLITQTVNGNYVFDNRSDEMSDVIAGSPLIDVVKFICTE